MIGGNPCNGRVKRRLPLQVDTGPCDYVKAVEGIDMHAKGDGEVQVNNPGRLHPVDDFRMVLGEKGTSQCRSHKAGASTAYGGTNVMSRVIRPPLRFADAVDDRLCSLLHGRHPMCPEPPAVGQVASSNGGAMPLGLKFRESRKKPAAHGVFEIRGIGWVLNFSKRPVSRESLEHTRH